MSDQSALVLAWLIIAMMQTWPPPRRQYLMMAVTWSVFAVCFVGWLGTKA